MAEKIVANYKHELTYSNTAQNVIGATTNTTLRTVDTVAGDTANVRKFGVVYSITAVTAIEDPVDVNMTFKVYALDGTLLGSRLGGGAFVAGSTVTAQGCYLQIVASGGAVVVLAGIDITSTRAAVADALTFVCAAETVSDGDTLTLYLSDTQSTYYDSGYIYGGARHTPALNDTRLPYRTINLALAALATGNDDGVVVLDSATYDEEIDWTLSDSFLLALSGKTPTLTKGIGARTTRSTTEEYNNLTAYYFNTTGDDANPGTWQEPVLTLARVNALQGAGAFHGVYGGSGSTISGIFNEALDFDAIGGVKIESDYFYISIFKSNAGTIKNIDFHGISFDGLGYNNNIIKFDGNPENREVQDCTFENTITNAAVFRSSTNGDLTINNCYFLNNDKCISTNNIASRTITINNNIFKNYLGGYANQETLGGVVTPQIDINNNIFDSNNINHVSDIELQERSLSGVKTYSGDWNNNTFVNGIGKAVWFSTTHADDAITAINIDNNIIMDKAKGIDNDNTNHTVTAENNCFYNNTAKTEGLVTNTAPISSDPLICDEDNGFYGISPISPCYRTGNDSDDVGIKTRLFEVNESDITINGFIIDGQDEYSNGLFIVDTANHTDLIMKWCTLKGFIGGAVDLYDDGTDSDAQILNCNINNNGYGVGLQYGGNTITECLFYRNSQQGLYTNYTKQTINHCVFFLNNYGLYFDTNSAIISLKNSITNSNSTYGIYSGQPIIVTYMDIADAVTTNITRTATSNITNNPLFINTTDGSEDFNIKTTEAGYTNDSACKDASDTTAFPDIGAYDLLRSLTQSYWRKYQFEFNPQVEWGLESKGYLSFETINGTRDNFAKAHKRTFAFDYGSRDQVSSEELRQKMEYFATRFKTRENEISSNEKIKFRLKLQPTAHLETGTASAVVAADKTLTDTGKDWIENQFKGFHVGIKWDSGTNMVIDATAKTGTVGGAAWTVDEYIGYYVPLNGYYYYILSNTAAALTFSDPELTLVDIDGVLQNWAIEKYFKIESNSSNEMCVNDDDSELEDGNYNFSVDFIECRVNVKKFGYSQPAYLYTNEKAKTGYEILFEEI